MPQLLIWEGSQDYRQQLEKARTRFDEILGRLYKNQFRCSFIGDLRFDLNAEPEVWLNDNLPLRRYVDTPEQARDLALRHGRCGWWSLNDLDQFANSKGPMFEQTMWELGYRRAKKDSTRWAKRTKKDGIDGPRKEYLEERHGARFMNLSDEEITRLNGLWVMSNASDGISRTYDIQAGKTGMIYVALQANPFAGSTTEALCELGAQIRNRGHIAKQQEGFYMDARNVRLGKQAGIYVKATRPDESYVKCIWPSLMPSARIFELLNDLPDRVAKLEAKASTN